MKYRVFRKLNEEYVTDIYTDRNGNMFKIHEDYLERITPATHIIEYCTDLMDIAEETLYEGDLIRVCCKKEDIDFVGVIEYVVGAFSIFKFDESNIPTIFAGDLVEVMNYCSVKKVGNANFK